MITVVMMWLWTVTLTLTLGPGYTIGYPVWKFVYLDLQNSLDLRIQARGYAPQNQLEDSLLSYLS